MEAVIAQLGRGGLAWILPPGGSVSGSCSARVCCSHGRCLNLTRQPSLTGALLAHLGYQVSVPSFASSGWLCEHSARSARRAVCLCSSLEPTDASAAVASGCSKLANVWERTALLGHVRQKQQRCCALLPARVSHVETGDHESQFSRCTDLPQEPLQWPCLNWPWA